VPGPSMRAGSSVIAALMVLVRLPHVMSGGVEAADSAGSSSGEK